ncbi:galactose-1-phosphate uridylyltransferase [Thermofilum pendens]|uniref:Galactose-1-phosphate uridylyltransferase n=1 Tax=Thermofilum pendens (strain DSM 2475 / Hrk 5) TaxID=368408 RepID=A1RZ81_THEPD|nr:galactose-1-phosphate uridylyltransferase [Thermofilum pendens]ABL78511.1 galactose-1-phosphate uridylyltransferase [Thermofilum pendens Hrk 5]
MEDSYNELRWNPVLGCWVIVSSSRARRPWRRVEKCPFCPGSEETGYGWDVLVLDNKFPALRRDARVSRSSRDLYVVREAYGAAKVVVETPEHEGDLDSIPFENLVKYLESLGRVTEEECRDERVAYVLPFRNKGEVIGVSLTHPHSQVYVLPFVPPRVSREMAMAREFREKRGGCLFCHVLELEAEEGARTVYENEHFLVFLPFFAMWPYELHVYPKRHVGSLNTLSSDERVSLADALRVTVAAYNSLFGFSLPYIMVFHQSPCRDEGSLHLHVEFYPVHRSADKLKYPAGIEWGGWVFTYDGLPEERAGELREAFRRGVEKLKANGYAARGRVCGTS